MFIGSETSNLEAALSNPHDFFTCDPKWPQCRFDFTKPHVIVEEFVFKSGTFDKMVIYQDYFSEKNQDRLMDPVKQKKIRLPKPQTSNLLLERNYHFCRIKNLTGRLAELFGSENAEEKDKLLLCKYLEMSEKVSVIEAHKRMVKFC